MPPGICFFFFFLGGLFPNPGLLIDLNYIFWVCIFLTAIFISVKQRNETSSEHIWNFKTYPQKRDFNFDNLFISRHLRTNSCVFPSKKDSIVQTAREMTRTAQNQGKVIFDLPRPLPPRQQYFNNSPPPGPKGWTCPGGCPGGLVTSKIEPCFRWTDSRSLMLAFRTESPSPISSKMVIPAWCELLASITFSYCWFPHDVTKIQTTKLSTLLRFYFHGVLEQLKININFQTNFRFKRFLGFVIEYAWISKLLHNAAFTWRPR